MGCRLHMVLPPEVLLQFLYLLYRYVAFLLLSRPLLLGSPASLHQFEVWRFFGVIGWLPLRFLLVACNLLVASLPTSITVSSLSYLPFSNLSGNRRPLNLPSWRRMGYRLIGFNLCCWLLVPWHQSGALLCSISWLSSRLNLLLYLLCLNTRSFRGFFSHKLNQHIVFVLLHILQLPATYL